MEPYRERLFHALGLDDPNQGARTIEVARFDSSFAAHPRKTLLHVIPGGLFLALAPLQFSSRLRTRHLRLHRWSGRVLVAAGLASGLNGLYFGLLMPFAGPPEAIAIALFGGLFVLALVRGFLAIRRHDPARPPRVDDPRVRDRTRHRHRAGPGRDLRPRARAGGGRAGHGLPALGLAGLDRDGGCRRAVDPAHRPHALAAPELARLDGSGDRAGGIRATSCWRPSRGTRPSGSRPRSRLASILAGRSAARRRILWLVEMYTRSSRFADCLRVMLEAGATLDDPLLTALLIDDDGRVRAGLAVDPQALGRRFDLECAIRPARRVGPARVRGVQLGPLRRALRLQGRRRRARGRGWRGHRRANPALPRREQSTGTTAVRPWSAGPGRGGSRCPAQGRTWGRGFEWETQVLDVTPLSYAQCGLYSQFHRRESDVYSNLACLCRSVTGRSPAIPTSRIGELALGLTSGQEEDRYCGRRPLSPSAAERLCLMDGSPRHRPSRRFRPSSREHARRRSPRRWSSAPRSWSSTSSSRATATWSSSTTRRSTAPPTGRGSVRELTLRRCARCRPAIRRASGTASAASACPRCRRRSAFLRDRSQVMIEIKSDSVTDDEDGGIEAHTIEEIRRARHGEGQRAHLVRPPRAAALPEGGARDPARPPLRTTPSRTRCVAGAREVGVRPGDAGEGHADRRAVRPRPRGRRSASPPGCVDDPEELAALARFELYGFASNRPGVLIDAVRERA